MSISAFRGPSRLVRVVLAALFVVGGTASVAAATTGATTSGLSITFYYGETSGSKNSEHKGGFGNGYPTVVCSDAPNNSSSNYVVQFLWDRTLQPDDVLKDRMLSYNSAYYQSASFSTYYDRKYHSYVNWSGVPSAPNSTSGFTTARYASC